MTVEPGAPERNLARAAGRTAEAAQAGAQIVLLPEALDCGWTHPSARELAGAIPGGGAFEALRTAAAQCRVHLCAGIIERSGDCLYNSAVFLSPDGELLLHHRKLNELDFARALYSRGDRLGVAETEFGRIGLMICADAFAEGLVISRSLGHMGAGWRHECLAARSKASPVPADRLAVEWRRLAGRVEALERPVVDESFAPLAGA